MTRRKPTPSPFSLFSFQDIITATTGILVLLALILAMSVVIQKTAGAPPTTEYVADLQQELEAIDRDINDLQATASAKNMKRELISSFSPEELANQLKTLKASVDHATAVNKTTLEKIEDEEKKLEASGARKRLEQLRDEQERLEKEARAAGLKLNEMSSADRVVYNFRSTSSLPYLVEVSGNGTKTAKAGKAGTSGPVRIDRTVIDFVEFAKTVKGRERYFVFLVKPSGVMNYKLIRAELGGNEQLDIGMDLIAESTTVVDTSAGGSNK